MPQIFQVLRCYKCLVFQVHQTKKASKWECKLCGEKQSIKRHYGIGTAKDCRLQVQKLNLIQGEIDDKNNSNDNGDENEIEYDEQKPNLNNSQPKESKWNKFVENSAEVPKTDNDQTMYLDDTEVVLELPKRHARTSKSKFKATKTLNSIKNSAFGETYLNTHDLLAKKEDNDFIHNVNYNSKIFKETQRKKSKEYRKDDIPSDLRDSDNLEQNSYNNDSKKVPKIFLPPIINNASKWAHFVDGENLNDQNVEPDPRNEEYSNNTRTLFSLCDDNDLDNVLDI